mmetsp:Transcript_26728/g.39530  ORF Transcript_26728/g.39530 Transcript_26728/m.39530 type:complete len:133 (+) Transcript_26728:31-429(+)
MIKARTIINFLVGGNAVTGFGMVLMGLGVISMEEKLIAVASPFLHLLQIPPKPFFVLLGSCKILAVMRLVFRRGPFPEWFARIGLMTSCACGAYGHYRNDESAVPPFVMIGLLVLHGFLPGGTKEEKKDRVV